MKDIYFNQLEVGENVWIVYNENYNDKELPVKKVLVEGKIIENHPQDREICISDRYEEPEYRIEHEYWIEIYVNNLSKKYMRYYTDFYNKNGQMTISPQYYDQSPYIEVFSTKDKAKEYIYDWCNMIIERLEKAISKQKEEIEINKECINNIKKI